MQAGKLDRRITIQRRTATLDGFGTEDQNTWTDVLPCWSRVAMQGGREFERARLILANIDKLFVARYCSELSAVTEKDRIRFGANVYDIGLVENVGERNIELRFLCTQHR